MLKVLDVKASQKNIDSPNLQALTPLPPQPSKVSSVPFLQRVVT
jgi:hypothetical protein